MALDKAYFDAVHIDVVKKKYYNANKVNALLEDIRGQAEALEAENGALKAQLGEISRRRDEIGDTLLTAQAAARDIIGKAKVQAGRILADAQRQREEILSAILQHRTQETKTKADLAGLLYRADKASRSCLFCQAQKACNWSQEKKNLTLKG